MLPPMGCGHVLLHDPAAARRRVCPSRLQQNQRIDKTTLPLLPSLLVAQRKKAHALVQLVQPAGEHSPRDASGTPIAASAPTNTRARIPSRTTCNHALVCALRWHSS